MHEHIFNANPAMRHAFAAWAEQESGVSNAVRMVQAAADLGVRTIVDATPINLGRDVHVLREVSEKTGVNIIACTGLYYNHEPWMTGWRIESLVDVLLGDIEAGIQGTTSKAAIIKCASDVAGVTEENEKLLRITAQLHRATGVPITTHTSVENKVGLAQQDIFEDEGVDLSHVIIGHSGDSVDLEYLEALLQRGSSLGMDRFGIDSPLNTEQRIGTIKELCDRGWADHMVLSHDASCVFDWFPPKIFAMINERMPKWNFCHVPGEVVKAMSAAGISDQHIQAMVEDNPKRLLEPVSS
tara:strand:+ start:2816 stop:3709 length:894 start_codon:yes stop_codon:yes gene_type:complete